jgi:hypothetical protein
VGYRRDRPQAVVPASKNSLFLMAGLGAIVAASFHTQSLEDEVGPDAIVESDALESITDGIPHKAFPECHRSSLDCLARQPGGGLHHGLRWPTCVFFYRVP